MYETADLREETEALQLHGLTLERLLAERVTGTGTVKRVDRGSGNGVISPDEGDDDLPFRSASAAGGDRLREGARVVFEVDVGHDGLEAFDVRERVP